MVEALRGHLLLAALLLLAVGLAGFLVLHGRRGRRELVPKRNHALLDAYRRNVRYLAQAAGLSSAAIGGLGLLGWALGFPGLRTLVAGAPAMSPLSGAALVAVGLGLALLSRERLWLARAGGGMALALGALAMADSLPPMAGRIGGIAPASAVGSVLLGGALLLPERFRQGRDLLASAAALLGLLGLLAFLYGASGARAVSWMRSLALPTSVGLAMTGTGLLLAGGWLGRGLAAPTAGGWMLRHLWPAVLVLPVLLGTLRAYGERLGWFGSFWGVAAVVAVLIAALTALVAHAAGVLDDVDAERLAAETDLRHRGEQLAEAERFARGCLDGLSAHIAILDDDGTILAVNQRWRSFAAANQGLEADLCEGANYLAACDRASGPGLEQALAVAAGLRAVLDGSSRDFVLEYPCHAPREPRWFQVRATPFPGPGRARAVVAHEDISSRRQAEEALRAYTDLLDLTGQLAQVGGWVVDATGRHVTWTREMARILEGPSGPGVDLDQALALYGEASRTRLLLALDQAFADGAGFDLELDHRPADGNSKVLRTVGRPVLVGGRVTQVQGITQDITAAVERANRLRGAEQESRRLLQIAERSRRALLSLAEDQRRAQEDLRRLNAELEERVQVRTRDLAELNQEMEAFNYNVSHDLKAPLRRIAGFSQALEEDWGERLDEAARDHLARIRTAAVTMGQLIEDLLRLSQVGRREVHCVDLDLGALARAIIEELRKDAPGREVELVVTGELRAQADPSLMRIALDNLLRNAWKFTRDRTPARIILDRTGPGEFRLRDNGIGFPTEQADRIFQPFQRLQSAHGYEGTGIGLAIVQRVVHRHGGRIRAEGCPGEGAAFLFSLQPEPSP